MVGSSDLLSGVHRPVQGQLMILYCFDIYIYKQIFTVIGLNEHSLDSSFGTPC